MHYEIFNVRERKNKELAPVLRIDGVVVKYDT